MQERKGLEVDKKSHEGIADASMASTSSGAKKWQRLLPWQHSSSTQCRKVLLCILWRQ